MTSGSPFWQTIFLSFACVLILFEVVRGWRLGLMRQVMRILAIVAAYLCAIFGGKYFLPIVRPFVKVPDIVISAVAGAILALIVYCVITTSVRSSSNEPASKVGAVRLLYGVCGAITGFSSDCSWSGSSSWESVR